METFGIRHIENCIQSPFMQGRELKLEDSECNNEKETVALCARARIETMIRTRSRYSMPSVSRRIVHGFLIEKCFVRTKIC